MKKIFCLIVILFFSSSLLFAQGTDQKLLPVKVNGKWGFISHAGKLVIPAQFDTVGEFKEGFAIFGEGRYQVKSYYVDFKGIDRIKEKEWNGKFGYIDASGKIIIQAKFQSAENFSEGLAAVKDDNAWGYINKIGEIIISPKYSWADNFSNGLALVNTVLVSINVGLFRYIDKNGKFLTKKSTTNKFSEGLLVSEDNGKYGYIDALNNLIIPRQFDFAEDFKDGRAIVKMDKKYGFIDKTGKFLISPQFYSVYPFTEDLAAYFENGKYGFIDLNGNTAIEPQFEWVGNFSEGLAQIKVKDKIGYIDKTGKVVIQPTFLEARDFINGIAQVKLETEIEGKKYKGWIVIDKTPKNLTETLYPDMHPYSEGFAIISTFINPTKYGYIDLTGNVKIGWVDRAESFKDGIAKVYIGEKMGYIDKTGKYIWEPSE